MELSSVGQNKFTLAKVPASDGFNLFSRSLPSEEMAHELELVIGKTLVNLRTDSILNLGAIDDIPEKEIELDEKLGKGGFSAVYSVKENPTIACKFLKDEIIENTKHLSTAVADIVREAHILQHLAHPNIITLHDMGSTSNMATYFLVIDRISIPLSKKLEDEWQQATVDNGQIGERLDYARDVVAAMCHLHAHKIIYRDLKVDNLGIMADGKIKVYDFGLAKELKGLEHTNGKYNLTANTGSWLYMAPEVAKGWKYDFKVDVYSFAILLWEMLSGKYAYTDMDINETTFRTCVVERGDRPPMIRQWPPEVEELLRASWSWNSNQRPSFEEIKEKFASDEFAKYHHEHHRSSSGFFSSLLSGLAHASTGGTLLKFDVKNGEIEK